MLTENFGPPNLIGDAEDTLQKLKFADDMKATQYFTEFAKYKAKTYFNDQGYYHIASQALPLCIHKWLAKVILAPATFDTLKQLVISIDSQYWKYKAIEKERHKRKNPEASGSHNNNSSNNKNNSNSKSNPLFLSNSNDNNNNSSSSLNNKSSNQNNNNHWNS